MYGVRSEISSQRASVRMSSVSYMLSLAAQVRWDAQAADFKEAVESLSNVEEVAVTKESWTDAVGFDFSRWTVSHNVARV